MHSCESSGSLGAPWDRTGGCSGFRESVKRRSGATNYFGDGDSMPRCAVSRYDRASHPDPPLGSFTSLSRRVRCSRSMPSRSDGLSTRARGVRWTIIDAPDRADVRLHCYGNGCTVRFLLPLALLMGRISSAAVRITTRAATAPWHLTVGRATTAGAGDLARDTRFSEWLLLEDRL